MYFVICAIFIVVASFGITYALSIMHRSLTYSVDWPYGHMWAVSETEVHGPNGKKWFKKGNYWYAESGQECTYNYAHDRVVREWKNKQC